MSNNQTGFTLIETLFTIILVGIIMALIPFIFQSIHTFDQLLETDQDYEWNLFLIGIRKELETGEEINIAKVNSKTSLKFKNNGQMITYEPYGSSLRRRVNKLGHEIVLQAIKKIDFSLVENILSIQVEFKDGITDESRILIKEL